jgi:hypothetical protein
VRLTNLLVTGTLFVAVIAEGAYIIKTHRQIEKLTTQVEQLAVEAVDDGTARDPGQPSAGVGHRPTTNASGPGKVPPPRFNAPPPPTFTPPATTQGAAALPPVLDTPEAREQLRNFVATEMQNQREAWRQQQIEGRDEEARRRLDNAVKTLGLNEGDGRKLTDIVTQAQTQRDALREKIQSGQLPRDQVPQAMTALRESTDKQIRALVGDEKAQKFQELQRQNRGPGGGPGFGGRGFGGPGFAGGQPRQP